MRNKEKNDKRELSAYEFDTYTKMEVSVDHISDKFRENRVMKKIAQVLDSVDRIAGEDGKPILPLFITESVSKLYYRDNPLLKKENILLRIFCPGGIGPPSRSGFAVIWRESASMTKTLQTIRFSSWPLVGVLSAGGITSTNRGLPFRALIRRTPPGRCSNSSYCHTRRQSEGSGSPLVIQRIACRLPRPV